MESTPEITVRDLRLHFGEVNKKLARGQSFVVTRAGRPVARLTPYLPRQSFVGATKGGPALPGDVDVPAGDVW